jgi:hypothetical protein
MRKISKMRGSSPNQLDAGLLDARPRGVPGATITSWPGSLDIDLDRLFARREAGASVSGAGSGPATEAAMAHPVEATVSLSDGTRITFATAGQFETVDLV